MVWVICIHWTEQVNKYVNREVVGQMEFITQYTKGITVSSGFEFRVVQTAATRYNVQ